MTTNIGMPDPVNLCGQTQKKLSIAIGSFEAANVELKGVLDCL